MDPNQEPVTWINETPSFSSTIAQTVKEHVQGIYIYILSKLHVFFQVSTNKTQIYEHTPSFNTYILGFIRILMYCGDACSENLIHRELQWSIIRNLYVNSLITVCAECRFVFYPTWVLAYLVLFLNNCNSSNEILHFVIEMHRFCL